MKLRKFWSGKRPPWIRHCKSPNTLHEIKIWLSLANPRGCQGLPSVSNSFIFMQSLPKKIRKIIRWELASPRGKSRLYHWNLLFIDTATNTSRRVTKYVVKQSFISMLCEMIQGKCLGFHNNPSRGQNLILHPLPAVNPESAYLDFTLNMNFVG